MSQKAEINGPDGQGQENAASTSAPNCLEVQSVEGDPALSIAPPAIKISDRCYYVPPDVALTVTWTDAPEGLVEVTFYRSNDVREQQGVKPDVFGVDRNQSDGISVVTTFARGMPASRIWAIGLGGVGGTTAELAIYTDP